jgi:hypothetical protein
LFVATVKKSGENHRFYTIFLTAVGAFVSVLRVVEFYGIRVFDDQS